jgi:hypothetical protein
LIFKERKRTDSVYDLLAMDIDTIPSGKVDGVRELGIASVVGVSVSTNMIDQSAPSAPPKFSPEVFPPSVLLTIDTTNSIVVDYASSIGDIQSHNSTDTHAVRRSCCLTSGEYRLRIPCYSAIPRK